MATTAMLLQDKAHETVTGLLALGAVAVLQGLAASPLQPTLALLVPGLLTAAGLLIVTGLLEWRRHQPLLAVAFVAFGLFACSQLPQLLHPSTATSPLAGAGFLTLWGIFALLLANAGGEAGRPVQLILAACGVSLLCKVAALATATPALAVLAVVAGGVAGATALLATLRMVTAAKHA